MARSTRIDRKLVRALTRNLRRYLTPSLERWIAAAQTEGIDERTTSLVVMMEAMSLAAAFHTGDAKLFRDMADLAFSEACAAVADTTRH
jgi:hypothetical protein